MRKRNGRERQVKGATPFGSRLLQRIAPLTSQAQFDALNKVDDRAVPTAAPGAEQRASDMKQGAQSLCWSPLAEIDPNHSSSPNPVP